MARFKAALEQEARKSNQEDQMSSREAWEARSEAPPQTRGKDVRCARRAEDEFSCESTATLLDTDGIKTLKPFGMDLLHFYPLRGSLGRKPGRATQAKVRA